MVIHAEESKVKFHPLYPLAKTGDANAAEQLVLDTATAQAMERVEELIGSRKPSLLAVHALESEGANIIPRVLANVLADALHLNVERGVVQINRVQHTGAKGDHRLATPALFAGQVRQREYLIVDDFIGQGGTLANVRGFVEAEGGRVIGATVLTGKAYSAKLQLELSTLRALREKHGSELEQWWNATFGYGFERLTESEAKYLFRIDDAHAVPDRIAAALGRGS